MLPVLGLQQLGARGPRGAHVQVAQREVAGLQVQADARSSSWFTATKTPLGIFPPAPMRRSPGHTLMLCGLFWGVAVWQNPCGTCGTVS